MLQMVAAQSFAEVTPGKQSPTSAVDSPVNDCDLALIGHRSPVNGLRVVAQLEGREVVVHYFADLLSDALDEPESGSSCRTGSRPTRFGRALDKPLDDLVSATPARLLADLLNGGVLKSDVSNRLREPSLLMDYLRADDFLLRPLPNHLFQRDNAAWIYDGRSINPMAKSAASGRRSTPASLQLPPDVP